MQDDSIPPLDESSESSSGPDSSAFQTMEDLDEEELRLTLRRCCSYRRPAIVSSVETPAAFPAFFSSLDGQRLTLTIALPGYQAFFKAASKCLVTFLHRSRSCVFVTSVRGPGPENQAGDLVVDRPAMISRVEMRRFFRVPVSKRSSTSLRIITQDDGSYGARCVDISLAGMLMELPDHVYPTFNVGETVRVEVLFHGQPTEVEAEVRRQHGRRVGVFFPEIYRDGQLQLNEDVATVVKFLEREWRRRTHNTSLG